MIEYRRARREDAEDILDFINYVFSQNSRPHDFKKYNPRMYDSDYPFWDDHYVAVDGQRIKATLSVSVTDRETAGAPLRAGHVGQVSVHPYSRGQGHMRALMHMAIDDMRAAGLDFSDLGGQRQRYQYYGYTQGQCAYLARVNPSNVRHALMGTPKRGLTRDPEKRELYLDGECVGWIKEKSFELEDYSLIAEAYALLFEQTGATEAAVYMSPYDLAKLKAVGEFCENVSLITTSQVLIFNYANYLRAGLERRVKCGNIAPGRRAIDFAGTKLAIEIADGRVSVDPVEEVDTVLDEKAAHELILSPLAGMASPDALMRDWFPLTL